MGSRPGIVAVFMSSVLVLNQVDGARHLRLWWKVGEEGVCMWMSNWMSGWEVGKHDCAYVCIRVWVCVLREILLLGLGRV